MAIAEAKWLPQLSPVLVGAALMSPQTGAVDDDDDEERDGADGQGDGVPSRPVSWPDSALQPFRGVSLGGGGDRLAGLELGRLPCC